MRSKVHDRYAFETTLLERAYRSDHFTQITTFENAIVPMIFGGPQVAVGLQVSEGASIETAFHKIEPHLRAGNGKPVKLYTADDLRPCQFCSVGPFHVSSTRDAQNAASVTPSAGKPIEHHHIISILDSSS